MNSTFYNNSDMKSSKGWIRDSRGEKRLLKFKHLASTNTTLVLLNPEYAKFQGYFTLSALLKAKGLYEFNIPLWLDQNTGKLYSIIKDRCSELLEKDESFKLFSLFAKQLNQ